MKALVCMACSNVRLWKLDTWRMKKDMLTPLRWNDWGRCVSFVDSEENKWVRRQQSWSKERTVKDCQSKVAIMLWSHHEETRELPGERDNARNNARCTQARKTTHSLDGQDSLWKSQSEWQRTEINGESMFMVWPTLGSRTAEEQHNAVLVSSARCNIYISHLCYDVSVRLSVTEVHWRIIAKCGEVAYILRCRCISNRQSAPAVKSLQLWVYHSGLWPRHWQCCWFVCICRDYQWTLELSELSDYLWSAAIDADVFVDRRDVAWSRSWRMWRDD